MKRLHIIFKQFAFFLIILSYMATLQALQLTIRNERGSRRMNQVLENIYQIFDI